MGWKTISIRVLSKNLSGGGYDFINPIKNPSTFIAQRNMLVEKCFEFTGYDSQKPTLDDNFEPVSSLLDIIRENYNQGLRVLYWVRKRDLFRILIYRVLTGKNRYDLVNTSYVPPKVTRFIFRRIKRIFGK